MARQEKTLTELEFQPTLDVDRGNDLIWTVDVSDKSMSAYGTSKKVKVEAFIGDKGETGESSYSYIAYASDSSGSDFTMVFDENLDYIAIKTTTSPIASPQASDFTGLWKNYKGGQGLPGVDGKDGKDGTDGIDGASSYTYIAYASDSNGTDFTMTFNSALDYIAIKTTSTPIVSPQALDFVGLWKNYKGATATAIDGWIPAGETWTYNSATTVEIAGDLRNKYSKGYKVKMTQSSVTKFFVVVDISYSSPNTILTLHPYDKSVVVGNTSVVNPSFSTMDCPFGFPEKPKCRMRLGGGMSELTNDVYTLMPFGTAVFDVGSNFDTTNYEFIVPVSGYYHCYARGMFRDTVANKVYNIKITKNSTSPIVSETYAMSSLVDSLGVQTQASEYFEKGDTIRAYIRSRSGNNAVRVWGGNSYYSNFEIRFLGL